VQCDSTWTVIPGDPGLDAALGALQGRKLIFTNGSIRHAENVLAQIGISHRLRCDLRHRRGRTTCPSPTRRPYSAFLRHYGVAPEPRA